MIMNTAFDKYMKGIRDKFEEEKNGEFSSYFINPTPAQLKELCLVLFERRKENTQDMEIFKSFFYLNDNEDKIRQIEKFDNDKLKPLQNFLINNTSSSKTKTLNLIALLVDFNPRPYLKFLKIDPKDNTELIPKEENIVTENEPESEKENEHIAEKEKENEHESEKENEHIVEKESEHGSENEDKFEIIEENISQLNLIKGAVPEKKFSLKNKILIGICALFIFASLGYSFRNICFPKKNCMIWIKNHYEAVDCDNMQLGFVKSIPPVPLDQVVLDNLKKVNVCDTTTFFNKRGEPCIWYGKSVNCEYEYFTWPGLHPETKKTLKPISNHIIVNHIKNK